MCRRVVITGMGVVSPFGAGASCLWDNLRAGNSAVGVLDALCRLGGLRSTVAAVVGEVDSSAIPRKKRRSMSPMSIYACLAGFEAIAAAGLPPELVANRNTGLSIASTMGSSAEMEAFFLELNTSRTIENIKSTMFFRTMNHSCAANAAGTLGIMGRVISPSAACASGTLAIGLGYEAVAAGRQDVMLCGGADEHHVLATAVFDIMSAASCNYNDDPKQTPRPFDCRRDGVVCAEGAGILVLEELEHARKRGAEILAEVIGFATYSSPADIANPDSETMAACMRSVLQQARMRAGDVDYVNAHATATVQGDIAEARAISSVLGEKVAVSSLKGHLGHTMAASGAIELIASIQMMHEGLLIGTRNLQDPDPECGIVGLIRDRQGFSGNVVLKNSFALGGINSTVLVRREISD